MPWLSLILAGCFEIGFTTFMKLSDRFSRLWPTVGFLVTAIVSFLLLNLAARTIPTGTAYAVWKGIGVFGTAMVGMVFFKEPVTPERILFLTTLIGSVIGLKLVSAQ